jgi:hypothetical protein
MVFGDFTLGIKPVLQRSKYAEAEPLLVSAYEAIEAGIPKEYLSRLAIAGDRLVQLYETWGKPEQATVWRKKLSAGNVSSPE